MSTDNVAEATPAEVADAMKTAADTTTTDAPTTQTTSTTQPTDKKATNTQQTSDVPQFFNIAQACDSIVAKYDRGFKHLKLNMPMQFVDGGIVEFIDDEMKVIIATARMRFRNRLNIDKENGTMHVEVWLSDLSFERAHLDLNVRKQ